MIKKLLLAIIFFLIPTASFAATVSIEVDAGQTYINALEGTVRLPYGMKVEEIRTGGSALLFWIDEPSYDAEARTIYFAGTTPGGFAGRREVFYIIGEFEKSVAGSIWFSGVQALRNDGEGSLAQVRLRAVPAQEPGSDTIPPEPIYIEVGESKDLYDGKTFVSFVTQDKDSGIERYEVSEKFIGRPGEEEWVRATSPYEVKDNTLLKRVYVRAIDREGNEVVGTIGLPNRQYLIWITVILIVVVCLIYARRLRTQA